MLLLSLCNHVLVPYTPNHSNKVQAYISWGSAYFYHFSSHCFVMFPFYLASLLVVVLFAYACVLSYACVVGVFNHVYAHFLEFLSL